jgi:hypothetical protein
MSHVKSVLVICSNDSTGGMRTDSDDFQNQVFDIMGRDWKKEYTFHFVSPKVKRSNKTHTRGFFPEDAPRKKFDILWFCGCDGVYFYSMEDENRDERVILDTDEIKKRLHPHGLVFFTDSRGVLEHDHNIELRNGGGWVLDVRAYVEQAKEDKTYWEEAMIEDEDDAYTENSYLEAKHRFRVIRALKIYFLQNFKRTHNGAYKQKNVQEVVIK